jgi:hypothetical protein
MLCGVGGLREFVSVDVITVSSGVTERFPVTHRSTHGFQRIIRIVDDLKYPFHVLAL